MSVSSHAFEGFDVGIIGAADGTNVVANWDGCVDGAVVVVSMLGTMVGAAASDGLDVMPADGSDVDNVGARVNTDGADDITVGRYVKIIMGVGASLLSSSFFRSATPA